MERNKTQSKNNRNSKANSGEISKVASVHAMHHPNEHLHKIISKMARRFMVTPAAELPLG
jgi:hypothetical protein